MCIFSGGPASDPGHLVAPGGPWKGFLHRPVPRAPSEALGLQTGVVLHLLGRDLSGGAEQPRRGRKSCVRGDEPGGVTQVGSFAQTDAAHSPAGGRERLTARAGDRSLPARAGAGVPAPR